MPYDEYEISLSRELGVCDGYIRKYRRILARLEASHGMTTDDVLRLSAQGAPHEAVRSAEWARAHESLRRWSASRDEYARLLAQVKQTAPA